MTATSTGLLQIAHFADLTRWSVHDAAFGKVKSRFPLVPLSRILKRSLEPIDVKDDRLYKRITVRLYGQGVLQRDEVPGKEIGTKRQFVAHAGQLIISRIDARNGAFGLVPDSLENGIVTNDFWLFDVHDALPEYVMLVLSSDPFQKYWQAQSTGTTNRQRISEDLFLESKIALPPIDVQIQIAQQHTNTINSARHLLSVANEKEQDIYDYLQKALQIRTVEPKVANGLLHTVRFTNMVKWGATENLEAISPKELFLSTKYDNIPLASVALINPSFEFPNGLPNGELTFLPMECISDADGEISDYRVGNITNSGGYTRFRENDIVWAKITPCMQNGKCAVAKDLLHGYGYGSTEFHVIRVDSKHLLPEYVYCFLRTERLRQSAKAYFSGSAGQQRVGAEFLLSLSIPLIPMHSNNPSVLSQEKLVKNIMRIKATIKKLRSMSSELVQTAKTDFEKSVFC